MLQNHNTLADYTGYKVLCKGMVLDHFRARLLVMKDIEMLAHIAQFVIGFNIVNKDELEHCSGTHLVHFIMITF